MFRNGDTELRLTSNEMNIIRGVLDHTVCVEPPQDWTHTFSVLHGDKKDLDIVCQLLQEQGVQHGG